MPLVVYRGPYEAVWVPALGRNVERDEPVSVTEDEAARLVAGPDWAKARKPRHGEG